MTSRKSSIALAAFIGSMTLCTAGLAAAQKPDLSGVWQGPYVPDMTRTGRNQTGEPNLPFTPAGEKDWKSYDAANGDYTGSCLPFGLSRSVNAPNPFQIVQGSGYVAFLFEVGNWFHVVPDGRPRASEGSEPAMVRPLRRTLGRRHARRRHERLQRLDAARHHRPSTQRSTAPDSDLPPHRRRSHRVHRHRGRSGDLHEALEERTGADAAEGRAHRVLVRREQQGSPRGPHQAVDSSDGETVT